MKLVFIVCVNVLFLSNSQLGYCSQSIGLGVYRMCQCPLFKQFTTGQHDYPRTVEVFIVCVNVLFLSNSQLYGNLAVTGGGVYRMCQCPLFKQFTTAGLP